MGTFLLNKQGIKPNFENYEGKNIYVVNKVQLEERNYQFTVPSASTPAGTQTRITLTWPSTLSNYRINDMYMTWQAVNTSTTVSPTFRNLFVGLLDSVKLLVNQTECHYLQDRYMVLSAVQDYLRNYGQHEYFNQLQRFRNETGKTCVGDSIPLATVPGTPPVTTNGVQYFALPITVLFPYLRGMIVNKNIRQLDVEVVWARDTQSLVNAGYIVSNTNADPIGTNISYNNIRMNLLMSNVQDARLLKNVYPTQLFMSKWETKVFTQSWNVPGVDALSLDLNSVWGQHNKIMGVLIFIQNNAIPAYNDATAGLFYSGHNYIAVNVSSNSQLIVNFSTPLTVSSTRTQQLRYDLDFNKRRYGKELPLEVVNNTSQIANVYSPVTYIDLSDVTVDQEDEYPVSGISNYVKDISIDLQCVSAVAPQSNIYCMLNFLELGNFDSNNNMIIIK